MSLGRVDALIVRHGDPPMRGLKAATGDVRHSCLPKRIAELERGRVVVHGRQIDFGRAEHRESEVLLSQDLLG